MERNLLITGGAGFIGSHLVRYMVERYPDYRILCVDALTYAGNLMNLDEVAGAPNYRFVRGDVTDFPFVHRLFEQEGVDGVIHLAAESHVDRSIRDPFLFARTNVMGTLALLEAARQTWAGAWEGKRFHHVSTDEVYGALDDGQAPFTEQHAYDPHSPYSASKAAADHFVASYRDTYGLPVVVTNCSNNYGPFQFPEKLIPLTIRNTVECRPIPVYGRGENVRDWLYVTDHVRALDAVFHGGSAGQRYNIGGGDEQRNIDLVRLVIRSTDRLLGRTPGQSEALIRFVEDRPGHDRRYAIDATRIVHELGWRPEVSLAEGIERTVAWYLDNRAWLDAVTSGEYARYYERMYPGC